MPVFHVSGGGSALQDALLSTVYNATNVFQIEDGIYNPLVFSSNTITANGGAIGYNTKFILSSVNGAENCIVDGGTIWENDVFGGTMLSVGTRCMFADSTLTPEAFNLSCYGITFRNGYTFNERGAGLYFRNGNNKIFYDCIIERCFGEVSASTINASIVDSVSNVAFYCYKCKIRNNVGNRGSVSFGGRFYNCEVSNVKTQYAQSILEGSHIYNCIIHDIDNNKGPLTRYSGQVRNSLFYNIPTCQLFEVCRGSIYGNTFAMNGTYTGALFGWNTNAKQIIANNVFSTGALASRLSGPEVIVMNNYARSFSGDASRLSGNIAGYDPLFADPVNLNFRLSKYSPCISAGNANWLSGYYSQYDLDKRRFKDPPSMGAYQFNIRNADMPNMAFPLGGEIERISEMGYDAQLQYLESTGTQRIRLEPWKFTNDAYVKCKFKWRTMPDSRNGIVFGTGQGIFQRTNCFAVCTQRSNGNLFYIDSNMRLTGLCGSIPSFVDGPLIDTEWHEVKLGLSSGFTVDGVQYSDFSNRTRSPADIPSAAQIFNLFAYFNSNDQSTAPNYGYSYGKVRIASFSGTDGNGNYFDVIPVRIGKTGYMLDRISGRYYTNQGTGNFVLGPDIQA